MTNKTIHQDSIILDKKTISPNKSLEECEENASVCDEIDDMFGKHVPQPGNIIKKMEASNESAEIDESDFSEGVRLQLVNQEDRVVEIDDRPEWQKFLIEILDFRQRKVESLVQNHGVDSVETFLDAYAADREGGLRNHKFIAQEIEEEKVDEEAPAQ